ncbi:MAG: hypothetical protein ACJAQZ_001154 [Planctomycetota bacterium]|jgi:hypothetical protein
MNHDEGVVRMEPALCSSVDRQEVGGEDDVCM